MIKRTILYLLAVFQICLLSAQHHTVPFYDGTFSSMKVEAEKAQKPYFIFFTTPECDPCSKMETYTFTDKALVQYINTNYLTYKISVDSYRGEDLNLTREYRVMFYPTVILFDSDGKVLEKFTGSKEPSDFLSTLERHQQLKSKDILVEPIASLDSETSASDFPPPIILDEANPPEPDSESLEASLDTKPVLPISPKKPTNLFKISVSQQPAEGYGVQVGVYREYTNVIKEVQRLESNGYQGILVNFGNLFGAPVFKVVIGPFNSEKDAKDFNGYIEKKEGKKGMVTKLSKYGK